MNVRRFLVPALAAAAVLATAPAEAHHKPWHMGGPPWARPYYGPGIVVARPRPVIVYERPRAYYAPYPYYVRPSPVYIEPTPAPVYVAPAPGININIPLRFD